MSYNEPNFTSSVDEVLGEIRTMLVGKNKSYGNSALEPIRCFSKALAHEQILVRIDDKLSRIQRGSVFANEDTISDLIGYLVLLKIAQRAPTCDVLAVEAQEGEATGG